MNDFAKFLNDVLFEGSIRLDGPPDERGDAEALSVLRRAYDLHAASIAGPMLQFDAATALAAGRLLQRSAWFFLNSQQPLASPEKILRMPSVPKTPEQHLSGDLLLRFLPALHRRAQAALADDVLTVEMERTLREWPLSGVLADLTEPPLTPIDFGTHAGLNFLYAERLADHPRPGWFPLGLGRQYVELVWQQLGKHPSLLPTLSEP